MIRGCELARLLFIAMAVAQVGFAQTVAFEVATVKVNHGNGDASPSRYPTLRNGLFIAENASLKTLLSAAYGLAKIRISGPAWIDSDRFDLTAKAPGGVPDSELGPMLQKLIQERFRAVVHRETREMAAFDMVVEKDGLKIRAFDPAHPPAPPPNYNYRGSIMMGAVTMSELADSLASAAGRPVVDRTGVTGRYGFTLNFTPVTPPDAGGDSEPPDFFTAVQQQLGLRLESRRQPIEILVVDRAERTIGEN